MLGLGLQLLRNKIRVRLHMRLIGPMTYLGACYLRTNVIKILNL